MPNRILKESICTSENVDQLSPMAENAFYRLIVNCDDYGRMDARPKIIKSRLFPLKDASESDVQNWLKEMEDADLIIVYYHDGKPYLQMKTWDQHQQVRAKRSKYPSPDSANNQQIEASGSICKQMIADDSKCPRNPIQSNPNPNPNPNRKATSLTSVFFDRFWSAYPRHVNKPGAMKAFDKAKIDSDLLDVILKAIEKQKASDQWTKDNGQFIPHPATWLNQRRWEDELPTTHQKPKVAAQDYEQRDYSDVQDELMRKQNERILERLKQEGA